MTLPIIRRIGTIYGQDRFLVVLEEANGNVTQYANIHGMWVNLHDPVPDIDTDLISALTELMTPFHHWPVEWLQSKEGE